MRNLSSLRSRLNVQGTAASRRRRCGLGAGWLLVPALVFLAGFFLAPLVRLAINSFTSSTTPFDHYRRALGSVYLSSLENTFTISIVVTLLCLVLAYPTAYTLVMARPRVRTLLSGLIVLPFFIAVLVRTYALMIVLGTRGPINETLLALGIISEPYRMLFTRGAVITAMTLVLLPMMVLPLFSVMSRIDPNLMRAGQALGAAPAAAFWAVFFPLSLPGAMAGVVLVFVVSLGFFITPALVGGPGDRVLAQDIAELSRLLTSEGFTDALGVILLVVTLGILALAFRFVRFDLIWGVDPTTFGTEASGTTTRDGPRLGKGTLQRFRDRALRTLNRVPPGVGAGLSGTITGLVAVAVVVPILIVVTLSFTEASFLRFPPSSLSFRWYTEFWNSQPWVTATVNSLVIGVLTAAFAMVVGTMAALGLARARIPGKSLIVTLIVSPLIVPTVVGALSLYWIMLRLDIAGSVPVVVGAHALGAIPMVVIIVAATYQTFDERLELAAQSLGAKKWQAIRLVTLPLIKPGLIAGGFFAFLYSFDELVYTLFIRRPGLETLPVKLWGDLNFGLTPILAVVSTLEILVVVGFVLIAIVVQKKQPTRS